MRVAALAFLVGLLLVIAFLLALLGEPPAPVVETTQIVAAPPTETPEPLVPTRAPEQAMVTPTPQGRVTAEAASSNTPGPETTASPLSTAPSILDRVGLTGALEYLQGGMAAGLPVRHYINWRLMLDPPDIPGVTFWQMVRLSEEGVVAPWSDIEAAIAAHPGSFWLVSNEPDVRWQDNVTAARYAELYHEVHSFIKARDPDARVGAGGIALATPLRLAYLDDVLRTYEERYGQPMPVDLWSLHAFVLREESDSWGIGIPPGREEQTGLLYEIEDHGDLSLMEQHVRDFRAWMSNRGYREAPLAVTEFGVVMPHDYGFPPTFVADYLRRSFAFFATATGDDGLPADEGRLVQWWFWYSLYDDGAYPTGNLYDAPTGDLTETGRAYIEALNTLSD